MGPDAYTAKEVADEMTSKAGLIWQWGALDFAGGTVVHINAAVAGLVGAFMIGKRVGYGREAMAPHSLTLTMVGASLLWVGWFGFNAGSALEANGFAALAFINTLVATAGAVLAWCVGEAMMRGKASMLGAASGAVAGLVAITPAAGNVGIGGGLVIDGRIITGAGGYAGEWGHGPVANAALAPWFPCGCGLSGCLDTVGGARGLERLHRHLHGIDTGSVAVLEAWQADDPAAAQTVMLWRDLLAGPLAMVLNVVGSSIVPVGGGLANVPALIALLDGAVRANLLRSTDRPLLVPAALTVEPGLVGAALAGLAGLSHG